MSRSSGLTVLLIAALASSAAFGACGEDNAGTDAPSTPSQTAPGNGVDRAFAAAMAPHHRSAVEMAAVARERSARGEIQRLADDIVRTQNAEIKRLAALDRRLSEAGVEAGDLGVADHQMGMDGDAAMLEGAKPFDREFIDLMIPHHQGAIRMARAELANGQDPELKELAEAIVDAQAKEIDQMNTWRIEWFGAMSPAGGVPADEGVPAEDDHGAGHGM